MFSPGFARPTSWLQFDAVRSQFTVGVAQRFEAADQTSLLALDCWSWVGELIVTEDNGNGWSVYLDATSTEDGTEQV